VVEEEEESMLAGLSLSDSLDIFAAAAAESSLVIAAAPFFLSTFLLFFNGPAEDESGDDDDDLMEAFAKMDKLDASAVSSVAA